MLPREEGRHCRDKGDLICRGFCRILKRADGKRPYLRDMASWISFATVAGLPATVAPVGLTARGLPAGIQIVAPMWEDGTSIEFAALLTDLIGGFTPPPAF